MSVNNVLLNKLSNFFPGTYWDRNKFTNRTFFAPFAYKTELNTRKFKLEDLARVNKTGILYFYTLYSPFSF